MAVASRTDGSFENEDRSTKHPKLENEAPKSRKRSTYRKRSTQNSKPLKVELNNNFTSSMTQSESGGGSGCVQTYKGRQNPSQGFMKACQLYNWKFLDRISCISFIISLAILDSSYLNMHFFGTHTCLCRLQSWPYFDVCKYARALTQKVFNEVENGEWDSRVRLLRHARQRTRQRTVMCRRLTPDWLFLAIP